MRIRFNATQHHEAELTPELLEQLGVESDDPEPIEVYMAMRTPAGQRVMDRLAAEGTWIASGPFTYTGHVRAAALC